MSRSYLPLSCLAHRGASSNLHHVGLLLIESKNTGKGQGRTENPNVLRTRALPLSRLVLAVNESI